MPRTKVATEAAETSAAEAETARLRCLDLETLRARWRRTFRREVPTHLPRHLLVAMIAYRLQADAMGDLDAEALRFLKQIDRTPSKMASVPLTLAFEQRKRELSPGTLLTREWNGQDHHVIVLERGFAWEGRSYKSLSEIAKAITGTKWNGPRFFGLRDRKRRSATE